jgi:putative colanic acid biosysnthesis UDP-glucose lipid carrier transferase
LIIEPNNGMSRVTEKTNEFMNTGNAALANGAAQGSDISFYGRMHHEIPGLIKLSGLTTSFTTQPLDKVLNRAIKRAVDMVIALLAIVLVLTWLVPIMAICIKLSSPGPVFFLQRRNKRNGEIFTCIKFRSMVVNKEADILPAAENDPRITKLGRFLRRYYIDELPQFLNVLWGDMSVIGPRPHMISDNLRYGEMVDQYFYRHKVKPGITGLAQVLGYVGNVGEDTQKIKDRVRLDIFYWRHWSLKLDLTVLLRTIGRTIGL